MEEAPARDERGRWLGRAEALARAGRWAEALEAYGAAGRLARLRPEELRELAEGLARALSRAPPTPAADGPGPEPACCAPPEPLGCPLCARLLREPVTLPCGHTRCRRCAPPAQCGRCPRPRRAADPPSPAAAAAAPPRVNVVLGNLLERCLARESRARRLRDEGDELRERQELAAALDKYNQALEEGEWRPRAGASPPCCLLPVATPQAQILQEWWRQVGWCLLILPGIAGSPLAAL